MPSQIYSIFLKSQMASLHVCALVAGASCYINFVDQFLALYNIMGEEDKNILCDLYQFDMVMTWHTEWDPNPYVGDVNIRAFTSFMQNKIEWNKSMSFVDRIENTEGVKLIGEPTPTKLFEERIEIMKSTTFVATLESNQKETLSFCENWISLNMLETILCI